MSVIYFNSYFIYHQMFMITISIVQENGKFTHAILLLFNHN
jgi:hypothetical protein